MVVGVGIICDALSCGGGSCAVFSDTVVLQRERVGEMTFRCTCVCVR